LYENPLTTSFLIKIFRNIAGIHLLIGWLHCKWARRYVYIKTLFFNMLNREFKKFLTQKNNFDKNIKIKGFYLDNWISNQFIFLSPNFEVGKNFYIHGRAKKNLSVSVYINDKLIKFQKVFANQESRISFSIDQPTVKILKIQFSDFVKEPTGRRLAFLLTDTNIFFEKDIL